MHLGMWLRTVIGHNDGHYVVCNYNIVLADVGTWTMEMIPVTITTRLGGFL